MLFLWTDLKTLGVKLCFTCCSRSYIGCNAGIDRYLKIYTQNIHRNWRQFVYTISIIIIIIIIIILL